MKQIGVNYMLAKIRFNGKEDEDELVMIYSIEK
jgi:hypothetical protein